MAFSFGGSAAPSAPSFSFGQASTPAFGQATTATLSKASSTPLFGATASTFGAASTPGLFGASSTPAFNFGSQPAAAPAQSQPSLFGASSTPAFGATPARGTTSFGFGGINTTAAPTPSLFGQPQQQQPTNQLAAFGGAAPSQAPDLSAIYELKSLKDSYNPSPGNLRYRFQYLFLNVVENPQARVKPIDIDELQWRAAMHKAGGPDNPNNLWPVMAQGFKDLLARKAAQDEAIKEHNSRLEELRKMHNTVVARQDTVLRQQLEAIRKKQVALYHKLLRVVRYVDALEGRFAQAMGYRSTTPRELMQSLNAQLAALEGEVAPASATSLQGKVDSLKAGARLRAGGPSGTSIESLEKYIDRASMDRAYDIIAGYADALQKMQTVAKRNATDVSILEAEVIGNDMVS